MNNISANCKLRKVGNYSSANTTEVVSDIIDMSGYDGVLLFTTIATANSGNYLKAQSSDDSAMSGAVDLEAKKVIATANNEVVWLDLYHPLERYITANVIRGASTAVGEIYALQYKGRVNPEDNVVADTILGYLLTEPAQEAIT
jgi:hypothetical protein